MKYYVFKEPAVKGDQPLRVLDYEPNEFIISSLAGEFGPIVIIPELIQVGKTQTTAQETETYIQSQLPPGLKTNWNT